MSYDKKYRRRALEYWEDGHSRTQTAEVFKVGETTLRRWKSQLKETGELGSKKRRETWRKIDPERLKAYLRQHPDAYLREIGEAFGCSGVAIAKALKRLKISRKKNRKISGSGRKFSTELC